MLIEGIYVPLTAPFYRDGSSYLKKLEHNVHRYSLTPAAGLVAFAPGSEGLALTDAEVADSLKAISGAAAKEKVLIAGLERDSVRAALAVAEAAAEAGFDAVLAAGPLGWQAMPREEVLLHFRAIADASPLPVMLWSGEFALSVEEAAGLAQHPNVVGMFDAALTVERLKALAAATSAVKHEVTVTTVFSAVTGRMLAPVASEGGGTFVSADALSGGVAVASAPPAPAIKTRKKTVGFQVLSAGSVSGLAELLGSGVAGAMPAMAACAPQAVHEVYAAFKDGDPALAALKAERVKAADALVGELGIAGVKYACDRNGYFGGNTRLPRLPLDGAQREEVDAVMGALRN